MDRRSSLTPRELERMLCDETADPKALPLSLLEEITDGFSNKHQIGSGGFAVVYKGKLENKTVAVKRMSNTFMYEKEFHREVECLMMVKHKNLVRFLGYCADTQGSMEKYNGKFVMADVQQRLLCFEYLPKGNLCQYITDTSSGLQWRDRYHIIKGVCEGLHYLHQKNIVHLDLKPANILLDDNLVAKIADFGLSRCFDETQSRAITVKIGGTLGYLAPEFGNGEITYQFDIYSLGVIITEILTGKKGYHDVDEVVQSWSNMLEKSYSEVQKEQVRVCAEIGIECSNFNPAKRPDIHHIISRLGENGSMDEDSETDVITPRQINPDMLIGSMHAIWLSYQQLNPDIKQCMEYCSIFPKGSKLRMAELVRIWIAQGFVKTSGATEDMEDVAEGYIQELMSHSFLQPIRTSLDIECFTIHDVLHDILDKVTGNCFRIKYRRSDMEEWEGDVPRDVQHLFIPYYDRELITKKILGLQNLRTLIIDVVRMDTRVEEKVVESICKSLPKLRVLAIAFNQKPDTFSPFEESDIFSVPESISQLKNLCYLSFRTSRSCTIILPSTLNKLQKIQVLDFGDNKVSEFSFADNSTLQYIFCSSMNFRDVGRLISLQIMTDFNVSNKIGYELYQLRNLNKLRGRLRIDGLENVKTKEEALESNLGAKERLTELTLRWGCNGETRCSTPEVEAEVLEAMCPPAGLQILRICDYMGSRYPDWMMVKQHSGPKDLRQLEFWYCSQPGPAAQLVEAFPHLQVLKLWYCECDALPGNMEHLKSLKELVIYQCLNIWSLPTLPGSLEEFRLSCCNNELMKSCQTVGQPNWHKIQHIPRKQFY